ncbi:uncharacterized protein G2W53_022810 [Senna tora]|uniref:Uncharacterized protein n=1 Tax=Senna tora TaxID=362788 RepID=A0A834TP99_9FABA|nr:uncharacterized protein G2W53_022810 [Senna tora]
MAGNPNAAITEIRRDIKESFKQVAQQFPQDLTPCNKLAK